MSGIYKARDYGKGGKTTRGVGKKGKKGGRKKGGGRGEVVGVGKRRKLRRRERRGEKGGRGESDTSSSSSKSLSICLSAGHFECPPYSEDTKRSAYHVRSCDIFRLKQVCAAAEVLSYQSFARSEASCECPVSLGVPVLTIM